MSDQHFPKSLPSESSPCVRRCCLDADDICLGCFRTMDEICAWRTMGAPARENVNALAAERKASRAAENSLLKDRDGLVL